MMKNEDDEMKEKIPTAAPPPPSPPFPSGKEEGEIPDRYVEHSESVKRTSWNLETSMISCCQIPQKNKEMDSPIKIGGP